MNCLEAILKKALTGIEFVSLYNHFMKLLGLMFF